MPRRGRGPRLDWRRGTWIIRWTEGGRSRERSTGTTDRGRAEKKLAEFLSERRERPTGPRGPAAYLITDLLADYAAEHGREIVGTATLGYNMTRLLAWWGAGRAVSDITKAACQDYAAHRRQVGAVDNTIRRELSVLSAAVGHAHENSRLADRPVVWMPPPGPGKERWMTRKEVAALLRAARNEPQARNHLPLFILLALYGGARKAAILELRWSQVDLDARRIDWNPPDRKETIKRRARTPIPRRLLTFLKLARARRGSDLGPVLTRPRAVTAPDGSRRREDLPIGDIKKAFASACESAGLDDVTPHTLRHTCATWQAQEGVPMFEIAGYLGQTIQRTTERYSHHHPDHMERASAALDGHR